MSLKNVNFLSLLIIFYSVTVQSCKEDIEPVNEEEVINEIRIKVTDEQGAVYDMSYRDNDGDGPQAPVISSDDLPVNTILTGTIIFENTLNAPAENITDEILEEGTVHQLFYIFSGGPAPTITYEDADSNGKPIGLQFKLMTQGAYTGKLNLVLRHQPNKTATGVSSGDITNAAGESDVDISFDVVVN